MEVPAIRSRQVLPQLPLPRPALALPQQNQPDTISSLNGPKTETTATSPHSHGEEERPLLLPGKVAAQRDTNTQNLLGQALGSRQQ